jgi:pantoate--beta-alanine ligase
MSSRNRYLDPDERSRAVALYEALTSARSAYQGGERQAPALERLMHQKLVARGLEPQYATVADARTLAPITTPIAGSAVLLMAARLGTTRLIDNLLL